MQVKLDIALLRDVVSIDGDVVSLSDGGIEGDFAGGDHCIDFIVVVGDWSHPGKKRSASVDAEDGVKIASGGCHRSQSGGRSGPLPPNGVAAGSERGIRLLRFASCADVAGVNDQVGARNGRAVVEGIIYRLGLKILRCKTCAKGDQKTQKVSA